MSHFKFFYNYLGSKIFISLVIALFIGILDAFGLTMFLPLLQMISQAEVNSEHMGNLSFLATFIEEIGFQLTLKTALIFMLLLFTLKGVMKYLGEMYNIKLYQSFIRKIRFNLLNNLNKISFKYFVTSDVGRIQNTMTGEVDRVATAYYTYFKVIQNAVLVAVYMGFAFIVDWQFSILVAIGGGVTNLFYKIIYQRTSGASKDLTDHYHAYEGEVIQHVANYKYLKATGLIHVFADRLKSSILKIEKSINRMSFMSALLNAVREPMLMALVAIVLLVHTQFSEGNLSYLLISLLFFYRALSSLEILQTSWNNFLTVSGSLENMESFEKELTENREESPANNPPALQEALTLKNVSFKYGATEILQNINLEIKKRETVAFVGESGSGKTTLVNLISGLLLPETGAITLDNLNYEHMNRTAFQQRIGYITQEPVIFNDTIYNNVTFWAPRTAENVRRYTTAIQRASIDEFIETLQKKEDTLLGNNGINLSGGQKQRISIARELYKDIELLIMDEATSSLDSETEKLIQYQIEKLKGEYTILIIAHRLSTIKNADKVVLMSKGEIQATGTYQELAKNNQAFKKMLHHQEI